MSAAKIIEISGWADKHATAQIIDSLVDHLEYLKSDAEKAHIRTARARSLRMVLEQYARWLGRYYAASGMSAVYERHITADLLSEREKEAFAWVTASMAAVANIAAGPHPWLSMPNFISTRHNASTNLEHVIDALNTAILRLQGLNAWRAQKGTAS